MANMGKMSVSNYLAQSIIATTIFYAYGFGLYGKIGYFFGILLTIGIYTIQLFVSTYWLQKYRMGPVEYVWRLGTYLEKPRFKETWIKQVKQKSNEPTLIAFLNLLKHNPNDNR